MSTVIAFLAGAVMAGLPLYFLGRMVGEERGRVSAYARIDAWRRRERGEVR